MAYGFFALFPIAANSCKSLSCPCSNSSALSINASRSNYPSRIPVGTTVIGRSPKVDSPCPLFCRLVRGAMFANYGNIALGPFVTFYSKIHLNTL
jgi:hypothetical protein